LFFYCFSLSFSGDAMDRLVLRLFDMRNSLCLLKQFLFWFLVFGFLSFVDFILNFDFLIDTLIYVFYMIWCVFCFGVSLSVIEHPKGEFSLLLVLFFLGFTRLRLRCADFLFVLCLDVLCRGFLLADLVAVIGNLDCVFGSVDR
jgi:NADH-quinone oxidoreductase subunit D